MKSNSPHDDVYLRGVSALVVDDYESVRAVVAAMLEYCGATVTAVGSADEALEALKHKRPDVLVSDLATPDKGGYWLIGQVRALPPERGGATPAAALTGFTGPEHRASILRAGFQYHIEKPVTLEKARICVPLVEREPSHRALDPSRAEISRLVLPYPASAVSRTRRRSRPLCRTSSRCGRRSKATLMRGGASFDGGRTNRSSIELPRAILPSTRTMVGAGRNDAGYASTLG